jgi:hypothetical protein
MYNQYYEMTSKKMSVEEIQTSMNIFYVMSAFMGTFRLVKDILNLLFSPKKCVWLYRIYGEDK